MMTPLNLEQSMEISNMCKYIASLMTQICSIFIINKNGRIIESLLRDDKIFTNFSRHDLEMLYIQRKLQTSMNKELDEKFGILSYSLIVRDSVLEFIFPFYDGIILITTRPTISITDFAKKISQTIAKFESDEVKKLR